MSDSIEMNYYEPETTTWTVNLDGRYMSAVQNYLLADGIPLEFYEDCFKCSSNPFVLSLSGRKRHMSKNWHCNWKSSEW